MSRFVYVDEAGISRPEPFLVVLGVIVHADKQLIAIERHLDKIVARWIPEAHRDGFVFHATELFNGNTKKPIFNKNDPEWPLDKRLKIADELAAIPAKFRLPLATGWVVRETFPASDAAKAHWATLSEAERAVGAHVTAFMVAAMKVEQWMKTNAPNEVCMMIVEDNEQARKLIRETQNYHQSRKIVDIIDDAKAKKLLPLKRIKEDPLFQGKRQSSVLQVADFCAYVWKKFLMNDVRYKRFLDPMKPQFFDSFLFPHDGPGRRPS
jgi:Protein of unknown function (DUF3800)